MTGGAGLAPDVVLSADAMTRREFAGGVKLAVCVVVLAAAYATIGLEASRSRLPIGYLLSDDRQ
jgi:hypothetical protein